MTSEQKVKQVYPEAMCARLGGLGNYAIMKYKEKSDRTITDCRISEFCQTESEAWDGAAERLGNDS